MAAKIAQEMIDKIVSVMHRQAAVNARQIAGQYSLLLQIMLGEFYTCLYLMAVAAIVFAVSPILLA
jgi:hypothetical protein